MNEQDDKKAFLVILAVVAVVVLAVSSIGGWPEPGGSGEAVLDSPTQAEIDAAKDAQEGKQAAPTQEHLKLLADIDRDSISYIVGDDLTDQLLSNALVSEDAAWVAAHAGDAGYARDGQAVQEKLLTLAAKELDAAAFLRGFPENYPADGVGEEAAADADTAGDAAGDGGEGSGASDAAPELEMNGSVPKLYQWDVRWGYTVYSSTAFALTGCCPTSMSMVYQGLTGDASQTPYELGRFASEKGYETAYDGTDMAFLYGAAQELGLTCQEIDCEADAIKQVLDAGGLIIDNVGKGDFTQGGHYLVICGMSEGQLSINDPYSAVNSAKTWDVEKVLDQTKALYAFTRA